MPDALDYLVPALFLFIGIAMSGRIAWLHKQGTPVSAMLRVMRMFALSAGGFLLALLIMCRP
jgi:hypothetical protein